MKTVLVIAQWTFLILQLVAAVAQSDVSFVFMGTSLGLIFGGLIQDA